MSRNKKINIRKIIILFMILSPLVYTLLCWVVPYIYCQKEIFFGPFVQKGDKVSYFFSVPRILSDDEPIKTYKKGQVLVIENQDKLMLLFDKTITEEKLQKELKTVKRKELEEMSFAEIKRKILHAYRDNSQKEIKKIKKKLFPIEFLSKIESIQRAIIFPLITAIGWLILYTTRTTRSRALLYLWAWVVFCLILADPGLFGYWRLLKHYPLWLILNDWPYLFRSIHYPSGEPPIFLIFLLFTIIPICLFLDLLKKLTYFIAPKKNENSTY